MIFLVISNGFHLPFTPIPLPSLWEVTNSGIISYLKLHSLWEGYNCNMGQLYLRRPLPSGIQNLVYPSLSFLNSWVSLADIYHRLNLVLVIGLPFCDLLRGGY